MPLIEAKNEAHNGMLTINSVTAKREFRQKADMEGEAAVMDGKTRWGCIRKLQQVSICWEQQTQ